MSTGTTPIYVDIESLLDLRQAILSKLMGPKDLVEFINSEEYNFRNTDIFKKVDMTKYEEIYNTMTIDLLQRSTVTFIVNTIRTKLMNLEKRNALYGESKKPEVVLNVHPFELTQAQADTLQNLLFIKLDKKCLISIISKPVEEVGPFFIKNMDFTACYIYRASRWIEQHTDTLNNIKLPDTLLYFPAVYKVEDDTNEIEKIKKLGFKDIFGYVEFLLSSAVNINFLPIVFYNNIVTSSILVDKYNEGLSKTSLGESDGNIGSEV